MLKSLQVLQMYVHFVIVIGVLIGLEALQEPQNSLDMDDKALALIR